MRHLSGTIDTSRAFLRDRPGFQSFYVKETELLRAALDASRVAADRLLLVMERGAAVLALDAAQMSYHHVAQGELAGEPWMITF